MKSQSPVKAAVDNTETTSARLSGEDLKTLKAPFEADRMGVKVQSYNKDRTRAMLVLYLQHTDVQDRIETVDPAWSCEILNEERTGDTVYVRTRLTIKGVARENVGEGGDPKSAYSDALKRAAMLFGIGRYLYDSPTVWTEYNDQRDRFKQWSVADYEAASKPFAKPQSRPAAPPAEKAVITEKAAPAASAGLRTSKPAAAKSKTREQVNRKLMELYRPYLTKFPETRFVELLQERYQVGETRLMSMEQLDDLVQFLEERLRSAA